MPSIVAVTYESLDMQNRKMNDQNRSKAYLNYCKMEDPALSPKMQDRGMWDRKMQVQKRRNNNSATKLQDWKMQNRQRTRKCRATVA